MKEVLQPIQGEREDLIGEGSARGLRERNQYEKTELKAKQGSADNTDTPPVAINLNKWRKEDEMMQKLHEELEHKPLQIAVFGIATVGGIQSILDFTKEVAPTSQTQLFAIDLNADILNKVDEMGLSNVTTFHENARNTSLHTESIDLVIRDHVGNCCPPEVDRAVNKEAIRVLRKNGLSITNITTSELLAQSKGRILIPFETVAKKLDKEILEQLQNTFFDLHDITNVVGEKAELIRGVLLEIEQWGSFGIFGSGEIDLTENIDLIGHGEWFRKLEDHIDMWTSDGFIIEDIRSQSGLDSHVPKLSCLRHIVLLRKE